MMKDLGFNIIELASLLTDICRGGGPDCCLGNGTSCPFADKTCDDVMYGDWFNLLKNYTHPDNAYTVTLAQDENCCGNL